MNNRATSPGSNSVDLIYKTESFDIIGAAIQVHRTLGPGFSEPIYQESLEIELSYQNIPFEPHKKLSIQYREQVLKSHFRPDYVCFDKIIVEIKALKSLSNLELSQMLNYLKVADYKLGLLINFGSCGKLEWKRVVF